MLSRFYRFWGLSCILLCSGCLSSREPTSRAPVESAQPPIKVTSLELVTLPEQVAVNAEVHPWLTAEFLQLLRESGSLPENQGLWIQSVGQGYGAHQAQIPISAASVTKIATTLAAIARLGPNFRFQTQFGMSGQLVNGSLQGDLIIKGGDDPFFVWEDAFRIARELDTFGIQTVTGDIIIQGPFGMNFESDPLRSGQLLKQGLNSALWPSEAIAQFKTLPANTPKPNLAIAGDVRIASSSSAEPTWIVQHQSLPLVELLKRMNRYSNNPMADQIANYLGGGAAVTEIVRSRTGLTATDVSFINGSGLGPENKITPQGATLMIQALATLMQSHSMTLGDVMTIVGQDEGILDPRPLPHGLVAKSGTLNQVSALAGVIPTETQGLIWFSLFNTQGEVETFRRHQETLLQSMVAKWGIKHQETSLMPTLRPDQIQTITQPLSTQ